MRWANVLPRVPPAVCYHLVLSVGRFWRSLTAALSCSTCAILPGRGKPLETLAKLKKNLATLIHKQTDNSGDGPVVKSPQHGGEVCLKVFPARFSRKAVRVKLQPREETVAALPGGHVRVHVTPARFGRRSVRVRLCVEPEQSGPVKLQLSHAVFGDRVKAHLQVDEAAAAQAAPRPSAGEHERPSGPVSVRLSQNWRGRVKLHTSVSEPADADKLVKLHLHPQLLTKKVVAKIQVL